MPEGEIRELPVKDRRMAKIDIPVFGAGLLVLAQAAQPAQPARSGSGPLLRSEFIAKMDSEFAAIDTNRDKVVSKAELEAQQQRIAIEAATRQAQAQFARIDADRNGQVSIAEFVRATVGTVGKVDGTQAMARLDTNADQKVTPIEHRILTLSNFDRLDADRDGVLTVVEQRAGGLIK